MVRRKKKNTAWKLLLVVCLLASLSVGAFYGYEYWRLRQAHFVKYPEFGIPIPTDYTVHGIDVSRYQDLIDWDEVQQMKVGNVQIQFAFIKATEGLNNADSRFRRNWKKCRDAGLIRGAYHFFIPGKSGRQQAEMFISYAELEKGDLPPVLDIEQTYGYPADKMVESLQTWLDVVEEYYKVKPIIYTNIDFYNKYLAGKFDSYPLWIAHYLQPDKPRIGRDWWFWQHNESGRVNGILSKVDFNVFNGDSAAFAEILMK
jgi:lysozyme